MYMPALPLTVGYEWRQPSLSLVRQVFHGKEMADEPISSDVTEPQAFWFTMCVIEPGGVPDTLGGFPADDN